MSTQCRYMADFNIAGMRYWDGASVMSKLKVGKKLDLVAEPDNPYDPNAVAIYRKGVKLGFVPRTENALLAQLLRFGHADVVECRIVSVNKNAETWKQVHVALYMTDKTKKNAKPAKAEVADEALVIVCD